MNSIRDYLDRTYRELNSALKAEERGDIQESMASYLKAARSLFDAASISQGELKRIRVENAEKLMDKGFNLETKVRAVIRSATNPELSKGLSLLEEIGINPTEVTDVSFDDVAGLEDVKREVAVKAIYPITHPDLAKRLGVKPGGGLLLYGPPGTGKTHIVRAIANEVDALFIHVLPTQLYNQWFGNFEKNINKLFIATKMCSPVVLFFDEIDALVPRRRTSASSVMKRAVPQFLNELGGIGDNPDVNILVIGATNNPWDLDEAIMRPGRFDELVYVPPPDWEARRRLFEIYLQGLNYSVDLELNTITDMTEGFSGADIRRICEKTNENIFKDAVEKGVIKEITTEEIEATIMERSPSIPSDMIKKYEQFQNKH